MAPIGGGTFTVQNKILPGAYINFVSAGRAAQLGSRGVVALPLELNWGPENKVFAVTAEDFNRTAIDVFGYDPTDPSLLLVREALKPCPFSWSHFTNSFTVNRSFDVSCWRKVCNSVVIN